jgi:hypothetical protein
VGRSERLFAFDWGDRDGRITVRQGVPASTDVQCGLHRLRFGTRAHIYHKLAEWTALCGGDRVPHTHRGREFCPSATRRSHPIYLSHMLTITLCHFMWMKLKPMAGPMETFVALATMTVPVTIAVAELLYRSVERPGIALGSRIAQWLNQPSVPSVDPACDDYFERRLPLIPERIMEGTHL